MNEQKKCGLSRVPRVAGQLALFSLVPCGYLWPSPALRSTGAGGPGASGGRKGQHSPGSLLMSSHRGRAQALVGGVALALGLA